MSEQSKHPSKQQEATHQLSISAKTYYGPLPDPETLLKYKEIDPELVQRIVAMAEKEQSKRLLNAEKEQKHHHTLEKEIVKAGLTNRDRGQHYAFALAIFMIGCGTFLIANGHGALGAGFVGATMLSLVSLFIFGGKNKEKQLEDDS